MNKSTPALSIIVPVYNVAEYLPQCLDSLINQTYEDIEIICFNDASTDNSLEILKEYQKKDIRITIIDSKINIKQGGGRNAGIRAAKSEWVAFVDSDDWVTPDYAETLIKAVQSSGADIATADYYIYKNGDTEICCHTISTDFKTQFELKKAIVNNGARLWTSIFNKELFFDNNLFFPEKVLYEDNAILTSLFLISNKIKKIDHPIYYYRIRHGSTTNQTNDNRFQDRLATSISMIENTKRLGVYEDYKKEIDNKFFKIYYLYTIGGAIYRYSSPRMDIVETVENNIGNYFTKKQINCLLKQYSLKHRVTVYAATKLRILIPILKILKKLTDNRM